MHRRLKDASRKGRPLVYSAIFHMAALIFAKLHFNPASPVQVPTPQIPFSVSLLKSPEPSRSIQKKAHRSSGNSNRPRSHVVSLNDLSLFSKEGVMVSRSKTTPPDVAAEGTDRSSPYAFENQVTTKTSPILSYLYRKINEGISFPSELRQAGLAGEVTADLRFDSNGQWVESPNDIHPNSLAGRYFRIYILHQLRKLLTEPIPPNIWKAEPHAFTADARFSFQIIAPESVTGAQIGPQFSPSADPSKYNEKDTDGGNSVEKQINPISQGQYGRKLYFYRSHLTSPLAWKLGPISGYGALPVFGISPGWFIDKFNDLRHHRDPIDPLLRYRDDPEW